VLPGGKPESTLRSRPWHAANLRMVFVARSLRRKLGRTVVVERVRYRRRGWNKPTLDAVHDAKRAVERAKARCPNVPIVLVGHSMGGRVAVHLSTDPAVSAVAALAPWWPDQDADRVPENCGLFVVHGTADTWTDPIASRTQVEAAHLRGVAATWLGIDGAGHYMLSNPKYWHALTATFVADQLERRDRIKPTALPPPRS